MKNVFPIACLICLAVTCGAFMSSAGDTATTTLPGTAFTDVVPITLEVPVVAVVPEVAPTVSVGVVATGCDSGTCPFRINTANASVTTDRSKTSVKVRVSEGNGCGVAGVGVTVGRAAKCLLGCERRQNRRASRR